MIEIAKSAADLDVLFPRLRGIHRSTRATFIGSYALALAGVFGGILLARATATAAGDGGLTSGVGLTLGAFMFSVAIVLQSHVTYTVSHEAITKSHPVRFFSWTVHRSEIDVIALVLSGHGTTIRITTIDGKQRTMPMEGALQTAIATLYPEFGRYEPTAADRRRWKWLAIILATVIIGTVALLWWLAKQGLVLL